MAPTITRHAWQRFVERWPGFSPRCPRSTLLGLLARAEPEDLGAGNVLRLLANGYQKAHYYRCDGWRFVLSEDKSLLLTCERIIHEARKPKVFRAQRGRR